MKFLYYISLVNLFYLWAVNGDDYDDIDIQKTQDLFMHPTYDLRSIIVFGNGFSKSNTKGELTKLDIVQGTLFVEGQLNIAKNINIAKTVVMFLGDGMSVTTVAATRISIGGEEKFLSFEKFPFTAMAKTYCVDYQVPDSACTATGSFTPSSFFIMFFF